MQKLKRIVAAAMLLLCTTLQAQDFYTGGLYYNILSESEKTVEVTNINGGGIDYYNHSGYRGYIDIPEEAIHNGKRYSVVAIGEGAFSSSQYLNFISIPSSVKSIGDFAFYASGVKEIDDYINNFNPTSIGDCAFYGCRNLREFTIPSNTVSIGSEAFRECLALKKVVIGENVTVIGENAFYDTAIDDVFSNIPAERLFALTNNADLTRNATLVVPAGTKEAYAATDGWNQFANIAEIKEDFKTEDFACAIISYKNNSIEIRPAKTFSGEHIIPSTIEHDGTTYTVVSIGKWAYGSMKKLTKVTLPGTVKIIREAAFQGCEELEELVLDGVEEIHYGAFFGIDIRELNIPASTRYINVSFAGCSNIETITVAAGNSVYNSNNNCNAVMETGSNTLIKGCKNTVIPSNTKIIGAGAFNQNMAITEIEIPYGVECIEPYSFLGCRNLTKITIPNSVNRIGEGAFADCEILTEITIPDNVTEIAPRTFAYCSLKEITIPERITFIGDDAFTGNNSASITVDENNPNYDSRDNCNAIIETATNTLMTGCNSTIIPDEITTIGHDAFSGCSTLTEITIPVNVKKIGESAFYGCSALTQVNLPANLTAIGYYTFGGCNALKKITSLIPGDRLEEIECDIYNYTFDDETFNNCVLVVPSGERDTYNNTYGWSRFRMIVEPDYKNFELNVSAAGYATLYLDFDAVIPQGVELYTASTVNGNRLMMEQVEYEILPANTGVLVKAEQGTYTFVDSYGVSNGYIENNLFCGSAEDVYITPKKNHKYYVLAMKDGVVGMYEDALSGGTFKNNANKAYLVLSDKNLGIYDEEVDTENPGTQLSNSYYFDFSGTTAIDPIVTEVENNIYYDLSGRRVENPTHGIYIVNGKKRLVK